MITNIEKIYEVNKYTNVATRISLFLIASFVSLYFVSFGSSPLSPFGGGDYGIFMTMGQNWLKNGDIYTGLFDSKGPYHFLIFAIGLAINSSKWGVFILEVINMTVCLELMFRIGKVLSAKSIRLYVSIAITILFILLTIVSGATVEEWSLPFVLWPMLLCFRFLCSDKHIHPLKYSFVYGLCFGIISLIRINDGAIIVGIVLGLTYMLIRNKQYRQIIQNALALIAGFLVAILPAFIYFTVKDSLYDMVFATFIYNFQYKQVWEITDQSFRINCMRMLILLFCIIASFIYDKKTNRYTFPVVLCGCVVTFLSFVTGTHALRYMTMIAPFVYLFCIQSKYIKPYIVTPFAVLAIYFWVSEWSMQIRIHDLIYRESLHLKPSAKYLADRISTVVPDEDLDSIYSFDINVMYTDVFYELGHLPVGKYYTQQTKIQNITDGMHADIVDNFRRANPKWILSTGRIEQSLLAPYTANYTSVDSLPSCDDDNFYIYTRR